MPLTLETPVIETATIPTITVDVIKIMHLRDGVEMSVELDVLWVDDQGRAVKSSIEHFDAAEVTQAIVIRGAQMWDAYTAVKTVAYDLVKARFDVEGILT